MEFPDISSYRDVNGDSTFVNFTQEDLDLYLLQFQKSLTKEAKDLSDERFLRFVWMADKGNKSYIQAECRAQMKKTVVYKLDLSLTVKDRYTRPNVNVEHEWGQKPIVNMCVPFYMVCASL